MYREGEQPLQYYSKKLLRERGNLVVIMVPMHGSSAEFYKIHIYILLCMNCVDFTENALFASFGVIC